ncbi:DNA repair protein RecO [uncultured Enterovirga sp.]|uniref:DNA repair protein RecO n=1 Tax=uncultured Enterovirga sp. TaxID=2026352 RepID=UPI0035CB036D
MNWSDRGFILGARAHGETSVILEAMTREHGRHLGLVHGGRSRRFGALLQPGNTVALTWRARLDEQMGTYVVEADEMRAARLMASPLALTGLATLAAHLRLLAERDPHPDLSDAAEALLDRLDDEALAPALFARFEVTLLAELGFGLDLLSCAATGERIGLAYVSPRTGRAVGRVAGEAWQSRLLRLPAFLASETGEGEVEFVRQDIADAFRLTGHFLDRHVYEPRGATAPDERSRFIARAIAAQGVEPAKMPDQAFAADDSLRTDPA